MFSNVLVATDLSAASESVLHCVKGLLPLGTKQAVLVHAIGIREFEAMAHGMDDFLEPLLAKQKEILEAEGFETGKRSRVGNQPQGASPGLFGLKQEPDASALRLISCRGRAPGRFPTPERLPKRKRCSPPGPRRLKSTGWRGNGRRR